MTCPALGQHPVKSISRGKLRVQAFQGTLHTNNKLQQRSFGEAAAPTSQKGRSRVQQQVDAWGPLQRPQHPALQHQQVKQLPSHLLPLPGAVGSTLQKRQQQLLPAPFCVLDPPVLTRRIKQCSSWVDVAVLFAKQAQCMNAINLSALLTHLAHLKCSPSNKPVNWQTFISQVLAASEPQLRLCAPRQLSNMAWALASLGFSGWVQRDCSWAQQWQQQLLKLLPQATCRDVTNILWALAKSISSSNSSGGGDGSSSSSSRKQTLVLEQQHHLLQCCLQSELLSALHRTLNHSSSQDVSNALWSLATLHLQPSPELGQFLLNRAQTHFQTLKPQEVAQILWGISQLRLQPSGAWVNELLLRQVGKQQWERTSVQHQVMCLVACAHMGHVPPEKWIVQTQQQLAQLLLLPSAPQQHQKQPHNNDALTSPDSDSGAEECQCLADCSSSSSSGHSGSNNSKPNRSTTCSSNVSVNSSRHAQDLANTIWALGVCGIRPNAAWMQHYFAASLPHLAAFSPQELSNTLWGLAKLNTPLHPAWLEAYDAASLSAMRDRGFSAQGLGDVLASQVHLQLQPSGTWKEEWMVALRRVWGSADASAVCKTLWAAAKFQLPLGRKWLQQALQEAHSEVHSTLVRQELSNEDVLRLVYAVGRLCRGYLTQDMSDMLGLYCCRIAGKMTWQQLQRGAWGLARLKPLPSQHLVGYFAELAKARVKYMPQQQAAEVEEKLQLLKHAADVVQMHMKVQQASHEAASVGHAYTQPPQQQQQEEVEFTRESAAEAQSSGGASAAACDLAHMQTVLRNASQALQDAKHKALQRHRLILQHEQITQQQQRQQQQPAVQQQFTDQRAVQPVV